MEKTSLLLSNLHCPSCVSTIEDALNGLHPRPLSVSSSIVTSWVTVHHDQSLPLQAIRQALEDAGFDVCSIVPDDVKQSSPRSETNSHANGLSYQGQGRDSENSPEILYSGSKGKDKGYRSKSMDSRHIERCALCRAEAIAADEKLPASTPSGGPQKERESGKTHNNEQDKNIHNQIVNSMSFTTESSTVVAAEKSEASSFVIVDNYGNEDLWRATLAIGGMTCVACVNAIKEELEAVDWVKSVNVNLIMNNTTVEFVGKAHSGEIADKIESIGYDAVLDTVDEIKTAPTPTAMTRGTFLAKSESAPQRTVEIRIDGMFCPHCPERILHSMDAFVEKGVRVDRQLSISQPIMKITYTPHAPDFTIRQIISGLAAVDPTLVPSIYHPPTLEERSQTLHVQERREILRRVMLSVMAAIPTFIIGIVLMSLVPATNTARQFLEMPWTAGVSRAQWALFIIATPVYFFAADVFHARSIKEIRSTWRPGSKTPILQRFYRFGSMNMLISLGTSIAYISSVAQLIVAGVHPDEMANDNSFYFDSVVFLTMFLLIGRLIEAFSKSKTRDAVGMLGKLRPATAILVGTTQPSGQEIDVDLLDYGDTVRVTHGASPPSDGTIVEGEASFDESSLTGESRPVKKSVGDQVYSGTINKGGPTLIRITGVAGTSIIDQIIKVVREGQTRHAPIERIADTLTSYFVPAVTFIAICTWIIWLSLGLSNRLPPSYLDTNSGGWAAWSLQFAIAVFVVACPCGLGLAAPTALFVGGGLAAKYGILVKGGGEAFEKASRLDCIVFDKTGTLTIGGEPTVTDYKFIYEESEDHSTAEEKTILAIIMQLEENASHPIAKAISSFTKGKYNEGWEIDSITEIPGKGMKASFGFKEGERQIDLIIGNEVLMKDYKVETSDEISAVLSTWKLEGKSIATAATSTNEKKDIWRITALFGISDDIRPEAPQVVKSLQQRGKAVWMLSGDNYDSACAIGARVGISRENIIAGVLPSEKADKIKYLQSSLGAHGKNGKDSTHKRALVAMVGDGINDSPALTAADVGIAIGSGSDIAISSAEFVLVSSNLNTLLTLLDLSTTVFNRIKFNFGWALIYNLIGVPVAAGVLYPIVSDGRHVRLDPVWASLAMALSSVSVVCSSLALRSKIPGVGFRSKAQ